MNEVEVPNHSIFLFAGIHAHRRYPETILYLQVSDFDGSEEFAHLFSFSNLGHDSTMNIPRTAPQPIA